MIPSWSKDPAIASKLINARGETVAEKPSFRGSFKYKRCLIPADGFYEWKARAGQKTKTPYVIHMKDREPFAFAGLWDEWHSPDGNMLRTCTIITTTPNELMSDLHNRMPVILDKANFVDWLNPMPARPEDLIYLIQPFPADRMSAYPVSTLVNVPGNDRGSRTTRFMRGAISLTRAVASLHQCRSHRSQITTAVFLAVQQTRREIG